MGGVAAATLCGLIAGSSALGASEANLECASETPSPITGTNTELAAEVMRWMLYEFTPPLFDQMDRSIEESALATFAALTSARKSFVINEFRYTVLYDSRDGERYSLRQTRLDQRTPDGIDYVIDIEPATRSPYLSGVYGLVDDTWRPVRFTDDERSAQELVEANVKAVLNTMRIFTEYAELSDDVMRKVYESLYISPVQSGIRDLQRVSARIFVEKRIVSSEFVEDDAIRPRPNQCRWPLCPS